MSIYTKVAEVLATFPQVRYVRRDSSSKIVPHNGQYLNPKCVSFRHGDKLQIGLKPQSTFEISSAASCALEDGNCPIASYELELSRGHKTHWITNCGSCISQSSEPQYDVVVVEDGQMIYFEGRLFTIHPDFNNNMKLVVVDLNTL